MAISMPPQTATSTRILEAAGIKPRELPNPPQAIREPTLLLLMVMEGRRRAADPLPLVAVEEAVGNQGRKVHVVPQAAAVAVVGAVVGAAEVDAGEANLTDLGWYRV
jgi:hypothetical protein